MNVNFLMNIILWNLYSSTKGISVSSILMRGSLCIFLSWQKLTHHVLLLDILKPFVCPISNFLDALLEFDALQFAYISIWKWCRSQHAGNPEVRHFVMLFIFVLNSVTDNTPLRDSLFLLVEIRKGYSDLDSKFPVKDKTLSDVGQSASQPLAMQVFHYSELPGSLISLLQIKEDCNKVLVLNVGLSYGGFQFDHMINCRSSLSEST